ncbi:putative methyltransferase PMT20 [Citrus sinensis]|nr:putative methyltransferase PMT20 [Citrus sinensis]
MKHKDGKPISPNGDKSPRIVPLTVLFVALRGFSFYLGGIFCSEKNRVEIRDVQKAVSSPKDPVVALLQIKSVNFPECSSNYQDYTPCTDPKRWKKYGAHRLTFMELFERKECLIPPPDGYKPPIKWPKSRDECWYMNVPYDWINKQKSNQNWLRKQGEKFLFPGGDLIPEMKDGTVRTAIDIGCGVASWGGDLLDRGILTVSLAPRDNHEAQVQFALERGIPSILGIISTQRLPFPSNSFDMAHCSRCLILWTEFGN